MGHAHKLLAAVEILTFDVIISDNGFWFQAFGWKFEVFILFLQYCLSLFFYVLKIHSIKWFVNQNENQLKGPSNFMSIIPSLLWRKQHSQVFSWKKVHFAWVWVLYELVTKSNKTPQLNLHWANIHEKYKHKHTFPLYFFYHQTPQQKMEMT